MSHVRRSEKGFSLIETAVVCLIAGIILGALFMTLTAGDSSVRVSAEKVDLQARARLVSDWIVRDLRNAISWEINANTPSSSYVKFNIWDWDTSANTWKLGDTFVEYSYDAGSLTLSRRLVDSSGSALQETVFRGITMPPFYTSYTDESANIFDSNELLANRRLYVAVRSKKSVGGRELTYTLVSEVKIRNG